MGLDGISLLDPPEGLGPDAVVLDVHRQDTRSQISNI